MKRFTYIAAAILVFTASAGAQQVSLSPSKYSFDLVGGETYEKEIFAEWQGSNPANVSFTTEIKPNNTNKKGVTVTHSPSKIYMKPGWINKTTVKIKTDYLLKPDNFKFVTEAKAETESEKASESKTVEASGGNSTNVTVGTIELNITTESDANITASSLNSPDVNSSPGSSQGFVSGTQVDINNKTGNVNASATIRVNYSQKKINDNNIKEDTLEMYYHPDGKNNWQKVGGKLNAEKNFVKTNASHFSTYGVWGEQESTSDTKDSGGGGGGTDIVYVDDSDNGSEENNTELIYRDNESLEEKLEKLREDRNRLDNRVDELKGDHEIITDEMAELVQEKKDLNRTIQVLESKNENLKNEKLFYSTGFMMTGSVFLIIFVVSAVLAFVKREELLEWVRARRQDSMVSELSGAEDV